MARKRPDQELTTLEARFVANKLKGMTGVDSVIKAGYSPSHAKTKASSLLRKPQIMKALNRGRSSIVRIAEVDGAQVIKGLEYIAGADIRGLFNQDGTMKSPADLPVKLARAVISVKSGKDSNGDSWYEYKLEGRTKALEVLAGIGNLSKAKDVGDIAKNFTDLIKEAAKLGAANAKNQPNKIIDL